MTNAATARIQWLSPTEGGPARLPEVKFTSPARFEIQGDDWFRELWSLAVEFLGPPDESRSQLATVRFLVEEAPHEWLAVGSRFEILEGLRVVAKGTIVQP
jgi:hypothetical protein